MFMASKHRLHKTHHHHEHMPHSHKHKPGATPLLDGNAEHKEWPLRRQFLLMGVTFLYSWSAIATVILLPNIGQRFFSDGKCGDGSHTDFCDVAMGKGIGALGISLALQSFISFLVSPATGLSADTYGRLPFLVVGLGLQVVMSVSLLAFEYDKASLYVYLGIRALSGLVEPFPFVLSVVADEAPPATRAMAFGRQIGCFDVAIIIAPKLFVSIPEKIAVMLLVVSSCLAVILICAYGESLPANHRLPKKPAGEMICAGIKAIGILNSNSYFRVLALVAVTCASAVAGLQTTYLGWLGSAFGIKRSQAASVLTLLGFSAVVVQLLILPVLLKKLGTMKTLILGLCGMMLENSCFVASELSFLPGRYLMIAGGVIGSLGTVALPCVSSLTLNATPDNEHGQVQGAIAATHLLGSSIGHLVYAQAYAAFDKLKFDGQHWPALTYTITITTVGISAVMMCCCMGKTPQAKKDAGDTSN